MGTPATRAPPSPVDRLSPRRRQVLELLSKGLTNDEIGVALEISPLTVRAHVTAVLTELDVANRTEATAIFVATAARTDRIAEILARPAIALLPFRPIADDPRTTTLAAGLTHDILTLLARWTWFPVISTAASDDGRSLGATSVEIGTRLGARFVVDGTLRRDARSWRVTVSVDDATEGRCLWTEKFDFADAALFPTMDALAEQLVAHAYAVMLAHVARAVPRSRPVGDLTAWELAHEGMALERARASEANARAQQCFRAALDREPTLVLAHFGLGLCLYDEALNQWGSVDAATDRLHACAEQCIALAPHAAEGYFLLGRGRQARGDPAGAVPLLEAAVGRNPSFAAAHALLGQLLLLSDRSDEGLERITHAARLAPGAYVAGMSVAHFLAGAYAEALDHAEAALTRNPAYTFARLMAIASAWWLGDHARAVRHRTELQRQQPAFRARVFLETFGAEQAERVYAGLEGAGLAR